MRDLADHFVAKIVIRRTAQFHDCDIALQFGADVLVRAERPLFGHQITPSFFKSSSSAAERPSQSP